MVCVQWRAASLSKDRPDPSTLQNAASQVLGRLHCRLTLGRRLVLGQRREAGPESGREKRNLGTERLHYPTLPHLHTTLNLYIS
jgi:hypothetical protein